MQSHLHLLGQNAGGEGVREEGNPSARYETRDCWDPPGLSPVRDPGLLAPPIASARYSKPALAEGTQMHAMRPPTTDQRAN